VHGSSTRRRRIERSLSLDRQIPPEKDRVRKRFDLTGRDWTKRANAAEWLCADVLLDEGLFGRQSLRGRGLFTEWNDGSADNESVFSLIIKEESHYVLLVGSLQRSSAIRAN